MDKMEIPTGSKPHYKIDQSNLSDITQSSYSEYLLRLRKLQASIKSEVDVQTDRNTNKTTNTYIEKTKSTLASKEAMLRRLLAERETLDAKIESVEKLIEENKILLLEQQEQLIKKTTSPRLIKLRNEYRDLYNEFSSFTHMTAKQLGLPTEQISMMQQMALEEKEAKKRIEQARREEAERKRAEEEQKEADKKAYFAKKQQEEEERRKRQDMQRLKELEEQEEQEEQEEEEQKEQVEHVVQEEVPHIPSNTIIQNEEETFEQEVARLKREKAERWKRIQEQQEQYIQEDYKKWEDQGLQEPILSTSLNENANDTKYQLYHQPPDIKQDIVLPPPPKPKKPALNPKFRKAQGVPGALKYAVPFNDD